MPASGPGKFKKLSGRNKKPLNTQRIVISDTQKYGLEDISGNTSELESLDSDNIYEESFLEDTPAEDIIAGKQDLKQERLAGKRGSPKTESFRGNNNDILPEKPVCEKIQPPKKIEGLGGVKAERKYKAKRKSGFNILSAIPDIFRGKSKTSNSSALEFAASRRRVGKKGRRNRRIFIYAGTGLAVVILMLIIVFVPGQAAPADTQSPGVSQPTPQGMYAANNTAAVSSSNTITSESPTASASVSPSVSPTPSPTPIPTTSKDVLKPVIDLDEEVQKFRVKADKYYNKMGYSNNHYKYTSEEVTILAKVIYGEARSESETGKIAVANVVMNRVLNASKFGNSITAVVTKSQFSGYNPDCTTTGPVYRKCLSAARWVLDWEVWVIPQDIYYYERAQEEWFYGKFYTKIGNHCFYRTAYLGRSRNNGIPPKLFERTFEWPTIGCKPEMRVYRLQYMLSSLGYTKVKPDKYFGQDTKDAIKDFQKKHNLTDDGIAGEKTIRALIIAFGEDKYYDKFCKD